MSDTLLSSEEYTNIIAFPGVSFDQVVRELKGENSQRVQGIVPYLCSTNENIEAKASKVQASNISTEGKQDTSESFSDEQIDKIKYDRYKRQLGMILEDLYDFYMSESIDAGKDGPYSPEIVEEVYQSFLGEQKNDDLYYEFKRNYIFSEDSMYNALQDIFEESFRETMRRKIQLVK